MGYLPAPRVIAAWCLGFTRACNAGSAIVATTIGLSFAAGLRGQTQTTLPPPEALKKLTVEELMDLEVTSVSKRPEKLSTAASAIQVITSDDIVRSGATSIPEALRLATNLEVAQIDSRQWAITARGFNNVFADKMLVLIDGRTVYTPLYAGVYWDVQDTVLEDIDRIEVISGPGATQWGANAVNGVINITTKNAKDTQGGFLSSSVGSELRNSTEVRYGGKTAPNVYYRVYAKYFDRGDSELRNGDKSNDAWRMGQTGFRVDWDASDDNAVVIQGDAYDATMGQVGPDNIRANGQNLLGRWTHSLSDEDELQLQSYVDHTHRRIPGSFIQDITTYDIDFQHHRPLGDEHDLVYGFEYRNVEDSIVNTPANAFLPPKASLQWFSGFFQDEVTLAKDVLHLTAGTKIEHNDYTGVEVEPSIRLAWTPDPKQTFWSAVSRAVRDPSRIDRDLFSPATPPYRVEGNPDVVSEKLIAYELGYRAKLDAGFVIGLATFYNAYDDLRSLEPLLPPRAFPVIASSGLRGHSTGAELTADWRVSPQWMLRAGWSELRVHSEPQVGVLDRATRDSIARDPNHRLSLRSTLNLTPSVDWEADLRYVSSITTQAVPPYTELNLRLGWRFARQWDVSVTGENLLHPRHPEFNAPATRREIQRSIYAKATWRF